MKPPEPRATINDGGPAFPGIQGADGHGNMTESVHPDGTRIWVFHNQGMTLRDFFAGQALAGALSNPSMVAAIVQGSKSPSDSPREMAVFALAVADAMIAEREKKTP